MTDKVAGPDGSELSDGLGTPLEDALKRAYYYTEAGDWRGPEVDEWDRWHAAAKVAAQEVDRLRAALAKANDQAEHFEREWYLRGDALEKYANPLNWNEDSAGIRRMWLEPDSTTPAHYNGFEAARAALKA